MNSPFRIAGQVDHPGEFLRSLFLDLMRSVMPQVLINSQRGDTLEPGRVACHRGEFGLHVGP